MDVDNAINYANSLIELSDKKDEAKDKRKLLLEAAELYIKASKNSLGSQSQQYYKIASQLYIKAQEHREDDLDKLSKGVKLNEKPKRKFKDVGGLRKVKDDIKMKII